MTYLLDTNILSAMMRRDVRVEAWIATLPEWTQIVICPIVQGEILHGILRLAEGKRRTELWERAAVLFEALPCQPVTLKAVGHYAQTKLARQQEGLPLDENDLWIAATTLALGAVLVTRDADFRGIGGLRLANPA